ncbi:2TM domain-containing protein [Acidovorax sp. ACV01]|uniref:2TM domain-containing protein n=1 Tax=Acidovorax sp. ACV01 TaxID=2769311 RepID=UPI00177ADEF9|nr:2TM domain-containing protein [Acidovorax sp. ACV01]MBD9395549.1 2TM domain-containing protein [Acidovorax sp. ACV01]
MSSPLSPEEIEALARRRASAKLGWYVHAVAFVLVNAALFAMSRYAFGTRPWSVYPLLGWGLGLVLHGVSVFLLGSGSGLRERMVQREREALQRAQAQEQDQQHQNRP